MKGLAKGGNKKKKQNFTEETTNERIAFFGEFKINQERLMLKSAPDREEFDLKGEDAVAQQRVEK